MRLVCFLVGSPVALVWWFGLITVGGRQPACATCSDDRCVVAAGRIVWGLAGMAPCCEPVGKMCWMHLYICMWDALSKTFLSGYTIEDYNYVRWLVAAMLGTVSLSDGHRCCVSLVRRTTTEYFRIVLTAPHCQGLGTAWCTNGSVTPYCRYMSHSCTMMDHIDGTTVHVNFTAKFASDWHHAA
jgi:hypothetical protein